MIRALLRIVLIIIVVAAVAAFFVGYQMADSDPVDRTEHSVGTTGETVDVGDARETGAEIAEQVAIGANRAQDIASDAALTAKIKSKMALDDSVEATSIDVDTVHRAVTLSGTVASESQRARALQLARETEGVTSVVDRLTVR